MSRENGEWLAIFLGIEALLHQLLSDKIYLSAFFYHSVLLVGLAFFENLSFLVFRLRAPVLSHGDVHLIINLPVSLLARKKLSSSHVIIVI